MYTLKKNKNIFKGIYVQIFVKYLSISVYPSRRKYFFIHFIKDRQL